MISGTAITDPKSYIGAESTNPPPNRTHYGVCGLDDEGDQFEYDEKEEFSDNDLPIINTFHDSDSEQDIDLGDPIRMLAPNRWNNIPTALSNDSSDNSNDQSSDSSTDSEFIPNPRLRQQRRYYR